MERYIVRRRGEHEIKDGVPTFICHRCGQRRELYLGRFGRERGAFQEAGYYCPKCVKKLDIYSI